MNIDDIVHIASRGDFERAAEELFRRQRVECEPYAEYVDRVGGDGLVFLPIQIFKTHRVYCGAKEPEAVFTSSGEVSSRHYVASLGDYEKVFTACFELFYGPVKDWQIRSLLPCYEERTGSSLIYMVDRLKAMGGGEKELLIGVSYALLDLAERGEKLPEGTVVMETGGMKGRREEISRQELHRVLCAAFGVDTIHSEYGMCELMSQAYSCGGGIFRAPPWMRVMVRDLADPFDVRPQGRGGLNIVDLANLDSCAFIETQDVGRVFADGSFTVEGRVTGADVRGCNLLVE